LKLKVVAYIALPYLQGVQPSKGLLSAVEAVIILIHCASPM